MKKKKIVSFCLSGGDIPAGKHITLLYKPRGELRDKLIAKLGKEVGYKHLGEELSDKYVTCQVVALEDESLYHGSSAPHITIEVKGSGEPSQSNDLIIVSDIKKFIKGEEEKIGILSAMHYTRDGKSYSINPSDWE